MPRILLVDDEAQVRELLRKAFSAEGYDIVTVPSARQSLDLIFKEPYDLVMIDVRLSSGESGISALKQIKGFHKNLPVVVYSAAMTPELEGAARQAGATEVLAKGTDLALFISQVKNVIDAKCAAGHKPPPAKDSTILIVDDEDDVRSVLKKFFERKGYKTIEAASGEEAVRLVGSCKISAVLLDIKMPGMDGLTVLGKMREKDPNLVVVMVTAMGDDETIKKAMDMGACGYALKPFDFLYLELMVTSRISSSKKV
jgi:two-component system response regulator (stage 0 sporulation protein F)